MRESRQSGRSQSNPTFNIKAFRENRTKLLLLLLMSRRPFYHYRSADLSEEKLKGVQRDSNSEQN